MKEIEIYKRLIIANIIFFILSFIFLEYSKVFRLSFDKHWIYSSGHNWWIMVALPSAFWGSLSLYFYSILKIKKRKFLYCILSLVPIFLFIILFLQNDLEWQFRIK
jgi:hypothetical protein